MFRRKELVMNVITQYVISKEAGVLDTEYEYYSGMLNGLFIGLGAHENVAALVALYNEVLRVLG